MGIVKQEPSDEGDSRESQHLPQVAKFIAYFRQIASDAALQPRGKKYRREPTQEEEAKALDLDAGTYSRLIRWVSVPRVTTVESALTRVNLNPAKRVECLRLLQEARRAHKRARAAASGSAPESESVTTLCPADVPVEHPVTDSAGVTGGEDDGEYATTSSGQEELARILWDADGEGGLDPPRRRSLDMTPSAVRVREEQQPRHQDDVNALPPPSFPLTEANRTLALAADALAKNVFGHWDQEAVNRGLDIPPPIPPHFRLTKRPVAGPVEVAIGDQDRTRFAALPGTRAISAAMVQAGDLDDLFAIYAGLGSGRIIVMGHYGSGKTATAILMLLNALDYRRGLSPDQRAQTPVPVLLTARTWNPSRRTLGDWCAAQLATMYDFLQTAEFGPDAAGQLVQNGRVALFLDGFDEMDQKLRRDALRVIARERRSFRLAVFTRIDDFANTVAAGHLHGAIALELSPVAADHAVQYLRSHQRIPVQNNDQLQKLINRIQNQPDDPVTQALDSPLNLSLVHDDPHAIEHILTNQFQTRDQVEDFLLGRVVPVAYGSDHRRDAGPSADEARRRLGYLATQMRSNDLAWWQMHHWAPAWWRCLANALAGVLVMGCIGALVFGPVGQYALSGHTGILFGSFYGASLGAFFGFMAGLASEFRAPHPDLKDRLQSIIHRYSPGFIGRRLARFTFNPAIGLPVFAAVAMAVGNQSSYLFGLPTGAIAAVIAGHAATRHRLISITESWWTTLHPSKTDALAALVTGLPIGLAYGLTKTPLFGATAALVTGFTFGLMTSVSRPTASADLHAEPDTSWRHDRQRALMIGLAAGIPSGLVLGIQNGRAHGLLAAAVTAIGLGLIIFLGCVVGTSDSWRTTLLFVQLRLRGLFPIRGMQFLNDARNRGILRTAGPYIQFKHSRLQEKLARDFHPKILPTPSKSTKNDDRYSPSSS
jgi:hypothetical protein